MLDELADTHDLAGGAELLLDGIVGVDGGLGLVGAVQVPGVEAGEVLQGAEELVSADCGDGVLAGVCGGGWWMCETRWTSQTRADLCVV